MTQPQLPEGYSTLTNLNALVAGRALPPNAEVIEKFEPQQSSPVNDVVRTSLWKKGRLSDELLSIMLGVNVLRKLLGDYDVNEVIVIRAEDRIRIIPNVEKALNAYDVKGQRLLNVKTTVLPDLQSDGDGVIIKVRQPERYLKLADNVRFIKEAVPYIIVQANGVRGLDLLIPDNYLPDSYVRPAAVPPVPSNGGIEGTDNHAVADSIIGALEEVAEDEADRVLREADVPVVNPGDPGASAYLRKEDMPQPEVPPEAFALEPVLANPEANVLKDDDVQTYLDEQRNEMANTGPVVAKVETPFEPAFFHTDAPHVRDYPPVSDGQTETAHPSQAVEDTIDLIDEREVGTTPDQKNETEEQPQAGKPSLGDVFGFLSDMFNGEPSEAFVIAIEDTDRLAAAQLQLAEAFNIANELLSSDPLLAESVILGVENGRLTLTAKTIRIESKKLV